MAGMTNRGKQAMLDGYFRGTGMPTTFYLAMTTDAPTADTNVVSDLTELAAGNGYTSGGVACARDTTDFDSLSEDDTNDRADLQCKDFTLATAAGGAIPASGDAPRYIVLTDDDGTVADREVYLYWDMGSAVTIPTGVALIVQNLEFRVQES